MDKIIEIKPETDVKHQEQDQPKPTPRPANLPRTIDPAILMAPAIFGFVMFSMGFAAGAMWMGWRR